MCCFVWLFALLVVCCLYTVLSLFCNLWADFGIWFRWCLWVGCCGFDV